MKDKTTLVSTLVLLVVAKQATQWQNACLSTTYLGLEPRLVLRYVLETGHSERVLAAKSRQQDTISKLIDYVDNYSLI